jgi:hypothetical protein
VEEVADWAWSSLRLVPLARTTGFFGVVTVGRRLFGLELRILMVSSSSSSLTSLDLDFLFGGSADGERPFRRFEGTAIDSERDLAEDAAEGTVRLEVERRAMLFAR